MPIGTIGAMLFAVGEPTDIAPFEANILDRVEQPYLLKCHPNERASIDHLPAH